MRTKPEPKVNEMIKGDYSTYKDNVLLSLYLASERCLRAWEKKPRGEVRSRELLRHKTAMITIEKEIADRGLDKTMMIEAHDRRKAERRT